MSWAEAVNTAAHSINRGPSTSLNFKLSEEVWSGKKEYESLWLHFLCYFVGYGDSKFGYLQWDDQNQRIVRSEDVIFNEAILYKDRVLKSEATKS